MDRLSTLHNHPSFYRSLVWKKLSTHSVNKLPSLLASHLLDFGSHTEALQTAWQGQVRVQPLTERWVALEGVLSVALKCQPRARAWMREVVMFGRDEPLIWAKAWLPYVFCKGEVCAIQNLGERPLGELLFGHLGWQRVQCSWSEHPQQNTVLRRSLFAGKNGRLLLMEGWVNEKYY